MQKKFGECRKTTPVGELPPDRIEFLYESARRLYNEKFNNRDEEFAYPVNDKENHSKLEAMITEQNRTIEELRGKLDSMTNDDSSA